jgi:hypothetical protein
MSCIISIGQNSYLRQLCLKQVFKPEDSSGRLCPGFCFVLEGSVYREYTLVDLSAFLFGCNVCDTYSTLKESGLRSVSVICFSRILNTLI